MTSVWNDINVHTHTITYNIHTYLPLLQPKKEFPWRNGYWGNAEMKSMLYLVDGENVDMKNLICLDVPSVRPLLKGTWKYGEFGPTSKEIKEATGRDTYNLEYNMGSAFTIHGINLVNDRVLRYLHIRLDPTIFKSTRHDSYLNISIIAWYSTLKILIFSTIYSHI